MTYSKDFEDQVKTCLSNLYDQRTLAAQSLIQKLLPDANGPKRTQAFRQLIMEIIESLRPDHDAGIDSKHYRRYLILQQRYIEEQQHSEIIPQLATSERQYYREHQDALQMITQILWERLDSDDSFSVETEAQRIYHDSKADVVDIETVFSGVAQAIGPLAAHHGIDIQLPVTFPRALVRTNRDILRQSIIWIVSRLLEQAQELDRLSIACQQADAYYHIVFRPVPPNYQPTETIQTFLSLLNASVDVREGALTLRLPLSHRMILLVDDNPDAPVLFRRLLVNTPYQLLYAPDAERGFGMAAETQPRAILLDIMMPQHDGWEVLHHLKDHPRTAHIPVIVCSVLQVEEMALSLGADAYLHKPPGEDELMSVLAHWESVSP